MAASSETAPLLKQASVAKANGHGLKGPLRAYDTIPAEDEPAVLPDGNTSWQSETKLLARYSAPLVVTYVLQYSYPFVTAVVAGRLGTNELAAASLASMTANITGLSIYEGLATSLDTLTSQAFGAGKKHLVGLHIQRMIILTLLVTIPISAIWIASPWILGGIVPDRQVAYLAGDFLRFYLIGAPGYGIFEALKRFTQAQGDFVGPMTTALICAPLNIFWNWLLVFRLGLGFRGAGLAVAITNLTQPTVFLIYVNLFAADSLQCWPGFQLKRAVQNWGPMIWLSIPGIIMVVSEWVGDLSESPSNLAFEILTLATSYVSTRHLAAQSAVMTISVLMYHIPFPTAVAASTRFGNLIGAGDLKSARIAFNTYYFVFVGIGLFNMALVVSMRHVIAQIFTNDADVRRLVITVLPIVAASQLFDATNALSSGLTRGLGRQKIAGWFNFGVYYFLCIPLSLLLTFGPPKMELVGLWIGPLTGLGIIALGLYFYLKYSDWEKAVEEAKQREE